MRSQITSKQIKHLENQLQDLIKKEVGLDILFDVKIEKASSKPFLISIKSEDFADLMKPKLFQKISLTNQNQTLFSEYKGKETIETVLTYFIVNNFDRNQRILFSHIKICLDTFDIIKFTMENSNNG